MNNYGVSRKRRFQVGLLAGLAAGIVASGIMLLLSVLWDGISLPEVFGSALTALMPPSSFNFLQRVIGGNAKHYFFYGILVGQCLVFALSRDRPFTVFSDVGAEQRQTITVNLL